MELGTLSFSLAVEDLAASQAFYEKLGFTRARGEEGLSAIMVNGSATIGLFHGLFDTNTLTFNPVEGQHNDIREIQAFLAENGIAAPLLHMLESGSSTDAASDTGAGPAHLFLFDPDGNPVLIDQLH